MKKNRRTTISIIVGFCLFVSMLGFITLAEATDDTIYVPEPTGIPETDWYNIQTALDSAMPGSTVVLAAGEYVIHRPLVKEGFSGTFKGAGVDTTELKISKSSDGDLFGLVHFDIWDDSQETTGYPNSKVYASSMLYFSGCEDSAIVSDMTYRMDEFGIVERSYMYHSESGEPTYIDAWGNNLAYAILIEPMPGCDTTIERLKLIGTNDGTQFQPVNPNHGIQIDGWRMPREVIGGTYILRDCEIIGFGSNAYQLMTLKNSRAIVDSCSFKDSCRGVLPLFCEGVDLTVQNSHFENLRHSGVMMWGPIRMNVEISHNTMIDSGGVWILAKSESDYTGASYEKCFFNIHHNDISLKYGWNWGAVEVLNYVDDLDWAELVVSNNNIHSVNTMLYGPIFTHNAHYAVFEDNEFTGSGPAAMFIGPHNSKDTGISIINNNFDGFTIDGGLWEPEWEGIAHIWLNIATSDCVITGDSQTTVVDFGSDNYLFGVTSIDIVVPGKYILPPSYSGLKS